jgi:hypothetical protein
MQQPRAPFLVASGPVVRNPAEAVHQATDFYDETIMGEDVCGTSAAMLSFVHRGRQRLTARIGIDAVECPRALLFSAQAMRAPDQIMVVPDVAEDPRFARNWGNTDGVPFRFYAGVPLVAPLGGLPTNDQGDFGRSAGSFSGSNMVRLVSMTHAIPSRRSATVLRARP